MAIYSYVAASKFIKLSASSSVRDPLPTTYQTSILLRVLNAEFLTLYKSIYHGLKDVFWVKKKSGEDPAQTQILRFSIFVLSACLCARYVYRRQMLILNNFRAQN